VNPPVHAWATLFLHDIEKELGRSDLRFLETHVSQLDSQSPNKAGPIASNVSLLLDERSFPCTRDCDFPILRWCGESRGNPPVRSDSSQSN
jgi:hypothetical protein